jgi:maltose/moltooligosaccharide transporter
VKCLLINLIAAPLFLLAKYTSRKFTHFVALVCGGLGLMSVYFITEPTVFYGMASNGWCWYRLQVFYLYPMPCYQAHCHLTKWAITWSFQLYSNPQLVAASILGF